MSSAWTNFDSQIGAGFASELEKEAKKERSYREVPAGSYICQLCSLKLTESKEKHMPMVKLEMVITDGDYARSHLFLNRVIWGTKNDASAIGSAVNLVKSLQARDQDGNDIIVSFQNFSQFDDLLLDVQDNVLDEQDYSGMKYHVKYDPAKFESIKILGIAE